MSRGANPYDKLAVYPQLLNDILYFYAYYREKYGLIPLFEVSHKDLVDACMEMFDCSAKKANSMVNFLIRLLHLKSEEYIPDKKYIWSLGTKVRLKEEGE